MDFEISTGLDHHADPSEDENDNSSEDDIGGKEDQVTVHNFSQAEKQILLDAQLKIKEIVKSKERARLVKNAETAILSLPENKKLKRAERLDLTWKTKKWLSKHAQRKHTKKASKHWDGRAVLYELEPDAVRAKQKKLYDAAVRRGEGPKDDFNFFQLALSHVWKNLPEKEKASYRLTATKWNNEGPSADVKAKMAEKHASKKIATFAQEMYISMGIRILFFVSFRKENGKLACAEFDFNDTLGQGKSYLTANPTFSTAGINKTDWMEHNRTYYDPGTETPKVGAFRTRRSLVDLETNAFGEPILPDPDVIPPGIKRRAYLQSVLRAFLAKHYELASQKAPIIPWSKFLPIARDCIAEQFMSEEVLSLLKEPSELREAEAHKILLHLYEKQAPGVDDLTFRMSHYLDKDGKVVKAHPRCLAVVPKERPTTETQATKRRIHKIPVGKGKQKATTRKTAKRKKVISPPTFDNSDESEDESYNDTHTESSISDSESSSTSGSESDEQIQSSKRPVKMRIPTKLRRGDASQVDDQDCLSPEFSDLEDNHPVDLRFPDDMCVWNDQPTDDPDNDDIRVMRSANSDVPSSSAEVAQGPTTKITQSSKIYLHKNVPNLNGHIDAILQGAHPDNVASFGNSAKPNLPGTFNMQPSISFLAFSPSKAAKIPDANINVHVPAMLTPPATQKSTQENFQPVPGLQVPGNSHNDEASPSSLIYASTSKRVQISDDSVIPKKRRKRDPTPEMQELPKRQRKETWKQAMSYLKPTSRK